tara:strand:+ start:1428 stop:1619 length:192 start_codon:yes stop_codon:yes gene_type:complete
MSPEEKLSEVQERFDTTLAQAKQIEQQITKMQEQLRALQQPLIEDQGAIKILKELVETVEQIA